MKKPRPRSFNPKRQISVGALPSFLDSLDERVLYEGSPVHKRNPGDFGLHPPSQPRPDKTLCDGLDIFSRAEAQRLLKEGVRRGIVSERIAGGFPQNIWAVTENGAPVEAQLTNRAIGTYHGYPMTTSDPLADEVIKRWKQHD